MVYEYHGLTGEECIDIAEAFGKYVDANNEIKSLPDFVKWWLNFRNSNLYVCPWYLDQARILASRFWLIKKFYNELNPTYEPDWVINLPLEMPWGNL